MSRVLPTALGAKGLEPSVLFPKGRRRSLFGWPVANPLDHMEVPVLGHRDTGWGRVGAVGRSGGGVRLKG